MIGDEMNYPNGLKKDRTTNNNNLCNKYINYANRGMNLEDDLNKTNEYYRNIDKAYIYKKPTPIKIVKVNYKNNEIKEGYFTTPSTTDYNGIYKGKYIDFEAKETKNCKNFPLTNIHPHQLKHLENIEKHGGIAFLIVRFTKLNRTYLLLEKDLQNFLISNKKTINIKYFDEKAYLIKEKYTPRVDYLEVLDKMGGIEYGK